MFDQINSQALAFSKSYTDTFAKMQSLTMEGFERIAALQMKALENRMNATVEFCSEASEVRDFEGARAIWPKGFQLAKENAETLYATGQEVVGVTLKTNEALGELVKGSIESANDNVTRQVKAATTNSKKAR
ncbi:MAG: phasin family protein [Rhodanobacteraceae bacterium]